MPLTLVPPRPSRTPNYRVRGMYLGIRVDRSTETRDEATAKRFLKALKEQIERGSFSERPAMTLAVAVTSYVQGGGEARFLEPILQYFGRGAVASEIDQASADAAAVAIYPDSTPATRNRQFYTPLSAVMKHVGIETKIRRPKGAAGTARTSWLSPEQFERLVGTAIKDDPEFSVLIILLYYTGLRLSEALRLCCTDIDLEQAMALCGRTKNGTPRGVHLPPRTLAALANHDRGIDRRGRIFRWTKCGELYLLAERIYARAGVDHGGAPFHVLRHSYGAQMTRIGADLVGTGAWKSATAARAYQHFVVSEEAKKADLMPGAKKRT